MGRTTSKVDLLQVVESIVLGIHFCGFVVQKHFTTSLHHEQSFLAVIKACGRNSPWDISVNYLHRPQCQTKIGRNVESKAKQRTDTL